MAKISAINHLFWYISGKPLTKNLRWVKPAETDSDDSSKFMYILSKDNDIVGFWPGEFPIWFDARYEEKWGKEIRTQYSSASRLKVVESHEEWLLGLTQAIFAISQVEISSSRSEKTCLHVRTSFSGFKDARCPDCHENVSPNLFMGFLLTAASELNELIWEHKGEKSAAVAVADDDKDGDD